MQITESTWLALRRKRRTYSPVKRIKSLGAVDETFHLDINTNFWKELRNKKVLLMGL